MYQPALGVDERDNGVDEFHGAPFCCRREIMFDVFSRKARTYFEGEERRKKREHEHGPGFVENWLYTLTGVERLANFMENDDGTGSSKRSTSATRCPRNRRPGPKLRRCWPGPLGGSGSVSESGTRARGLFSRERRKHIQDQLVPARYAAAGERIVPTQVPS